MFINVHLCSLISIKYNYFQYKYGFIVWKSVDSDEPDYFQKKL